MAIPRLEDIVISSTIYHQWLESRLPQITEVILTSGLQSKNRNEVREAVTETTDRYLKLIEPLPNILKSRWAIIFNGIVWEAINFLTVLVRLVVNPRKIPLRELGQIVSLTVFSQGCRVDTRKTILAILEYKKLEIEFHPLFMVEYLVMKDDVLNLLVKLEADVDLKASYRAAKIINKEKQNLQKACAVILASYNDIKECLAQQTAPQIDSRYMSIDNYVLPQFLHYSKNIKLIEFWIEISDFSTEDLMKIASTMTTKNYCKWLTSEMTMILLDYLGWEKFLAATKDGLGNVFKSLAGSWRSRHLCAELMEPLLPQLDLETTGDLLHGLSLSLMHEEDFFQQVSQIIKLFWSYIPRDFKEHELMRSSVVIVLSRVDYEPDILEMFLKDYNPEMLNLLIMECLKQISCHTQLNDISLTTFVQVIKNLYGETADIYLNASQMKMLIDERNLNCKKVVLDSLLALSCVEGKAFKSSLTNDFNFLESILTKKWGCKNFVEFIEWVVAGDTPAAECFLRGAAAGVVQLVYEHKLVRVNERVAGVGLCRLGLERPAALQLAISKPAVRFNVINKIFSDAALRYNNIKLFNTAWGLLLGNKAKMEQLLLSPECEMCLLNLCRSTGPIPKTIVSAEHLSCLEGFKNICEKVLKPYGLREKVSGILERAGHPNARSPRGRPERRAEADFRYRSLRALLARDVGQPRLQEFWINIGKSEDTPESKVNVTELSVQLAKLADIEVPIVL